MWTLENGFEYAGRAPHIGQAMRRAPLLLLFLGLLGLSLGSAPGTFTVGRLKTVADGVWFRLGDETDGQSNNVVIEMEDGLLVVDANVPNGARQLLEEVAKVSSKPVKWVFDTHHHGDHIYGNAVFTRAGAKTFAFQPVLDELSRDEPELWRRTVMHRYDVSLLGLSDPEPPQETWDEPMHVIEDGRRRVELYQFGWGHSRGDGWVYLPEEKILATGDAATSCACNNPSDANFGSWPETIGRAMELGAETVLPGHGEAGGPEILAGQKTFLEFVRNTGRHAAAAGEPLSKLVLSRPGFGAIALVQPPPELSNWVGKNFPELLRTSYQEARSGKPYGQYFDETRPH